MLINAFLVLHRVSISFLRTIDIREFRLKTLYMIKTRSLLDHPVENCEDDHLTILSE